MMSAVERTKSESALARVGKEKRARELTANSLIVERHILLRNDETTHSLLSMSRRELVSQFWSTRLTNEDLDEELIVLTIGEHDLVDVSSDGRLVGEGSVLERAGLSSGSRVEAVVVGVRRSLLVDVDVSWIDSLSCSGDSVRLDDIVSFLNESRVLIERSVADSIVAGGEEGEVSRSGELDAFEPERWTHVPFGYFLIIATFFLRTWHRP